MKRKKKVEGQTLRKPELERVEKWTEKSRYGGKKRKRRSASRVTTGKLHPLEEEGAAECAESRERRVNGGHATSCHEFVKNAGKRSSRLGRRSHQKELRERRRGRQRSELK